MRSWLKVVLISALILVVVVSIGLTKSSTDSRYAWLGVTTVTVDEDIAEDNDLPIDFGAFVLTVIDDSPADEAGILEEDIIISFDGERVFDAADLSDYVDDSSPGDEIKITVYRDDRKVSFEVTLEKMSRYRKLPSYKKNKNNIYLGDDFKELKDLTELHVLKSLKALKAPKTYKYYRNFNHDDDDDHDGYVWNYTYDDYDFSHNSKRAFLGVNLEDLSDQLGDYFGVKRGRGVLISSVVEDSPAEKVGLKAGDVIVAVDDEKVTSSSDLIEVLRDYEPDDKVTVTFLRNKSTKELKVTLDENDFYSSGNFYFNIPDISVNIPPMTGMRLGHYFDDDYRDYEDYNDKYLEAIEDYLEELELYQDEIDDMNYEIDNDFRGEIESYLKAVEEYNSQNEKELDEADRATKRAMKKLQREMKRLRKKIE